MSRHKKSQQEDYYKVLDVKPSSTPEEIKTSYRSLCKKYHPDIVPEDKKKEYEEKMIKINEAYSILGDENKKKEYDNPQPNMHDINDILNHVFMHGHMAGGMPGFHFNFGNGSNQQWSRIIQRQLEISVIDLMIGTELLITLPSGEIKKIKIPENTPINSTIRLKDKDNIEIHIILSPSIPQLTPDQIKKLKDIFIVKS